MNVNEAKEMLSNAKKSLSVVDADYAYFKAEQDERVGKLVAAYRRDCEENEEVFDWELAPSLCSACDGNEDAEHSNACLEFSRIALERKVVSVKILVLTLVSELSKNDNKAAEKHMEEVSLAFDFINDSHAHIVT